MSAHQAKLLKIRPQSLPGEEGITLSSTFLARYSPPQPENIHYQADAEGQLSLLDFTVETSNEPPDPDDFPNIDAFNTAMARWDAENAEALAVSMDSMCEWAPCPHEWYEPEGENLPLKASSMRELSEVLELSANFSIPTFDAWCDRANRQADSDEPPDTGIGARLPGPKPPKFPPRAIGQPKVDVNRASRYYFRGSPLALAVSQGEILRGVMQAPKWFVDISTTYFVTRSSGEAIASSLLFLCNGYF